MAKGFLHVHGIDSEKTFAPMAKMDSIPLDLAITIARKWEVHHIDVKIMEIMFMKYLWSRNNGMLKMHH